MASSDFMWDRHPSHHSRRTDPLPTDSPRIRWSLQHKNHGFLSSFSIRIHWPPQISRGTGTHPTIRVGQISGQKRLFLCTSGTTADINKGSPGAPAGWQWKPFGLLRTGVGAAPPPPGLQKPCFGPRFHKRKETRSRTGGRPVARKGHYPNLGGRKLA